VERQLHSQATSPREITRPESPGNPYLFIVGCPRSGTTLLGRMVEAHSQIAIVHETHWIPHLLRERSGAAPAGMAMPELVASLSRDKVFARWFERWSTRLRIEQEHLDRLTRSESKVSYAGFVAAIYDLHGEQRRKRFVGDKTPDYARHIPTLHTLWPWTKFVQLIRDGRDVCLSVLNWRRALKTTGISATWEQDPVSTTAL
jgi:hypothetical protein